MYRVSYIRLAAGGPRLVSLSHPDLHTAMTLHDALRLAGVHVRLWDRANRLLAPAA